MLTNYQFMKMLYSLDLALEMRYRRHHERLEQECRPRWRQCLAQLQDLLPMPLASFARRFLDAELERKVGGRTGKLIGRHQGIN